MIFTMAAGNNFTFIGRMVRDPEVRHVSDTQVCNFTLAGDKLVKGEKIGIFPDFEAWGKTAELIANHVHKGSQLAVEARYDERYWEDKNGSKRKSVSFVVTNIMFVGSKPGTASATAGATAAPASAPTSAPASDDYQIMTGVDDDDVPF